MSTYEKWLNSEKEWIGAYCKKTIRSSVLKVIPATLILLTVLFALLVLVNGNASSEEIIGGGAGGFFMGVVVSVIYLLFLLPGLSPKRYVKKIEKALKKFCNHTTLCIVRGGIPLCNSGTFIRCCKNRSSRGRKNDHYTKW